VSFRVVGHTLNVVSLFEGPHTQHLPEQTAHKVWSIFNRITKNLMLLSVNNNIALPPPTLPGPFQNFKFLLVIINLGMTLGVRLILKVYVQMV
jgi:hypothetical protein